MFLVHHTVSLSVSVPAMLTWNLQPYKIYIDCMTLLDITGIFVDIYKTVPQSPYTKKALCWGYIPIRCIAVPYMLIVHKPFDIRSLITHVAYWILIFGSYVWGWKLVKLKNRSE